MPLGVQAHLDIHFWTTLPLESLKGTLRMRAYFVSLMRSMRWLHVVPCSHMLRCALHPGSPASEQGLRKQGTSTMR